MELADAGIGVDVYDKNDRCLSQASRQNEGKIHLGYVYANDRSLRTARTMVKGALAFAPLMRRWLGRGFDRIPVSTPFHYVVHRDSLLGAGQVEHHFTSAHAIAVEESRSLPLDYFGADYRARPTRLPARELSALFNPDCVVAAYRTEEMGIDPEALASLVRDRLSSDPRIRCVLNTYVHGVTPHEAGATIDFETSGSRSHERYDHVVNALWDGRLTVDQSVGLRHSASWLYRVKYYLRVRAPRVASVLPSATIVLGPFGDIVAYRGGTLYLSWYPAGMRGTSSDLAPPPWPLVLDRPDQAEMRRRILNGLRAIVPSVDRLTPDTIECCEVNGGIIFAWGRTDISDPASGLHQRHAIGPRSNGRYHTVDTGKLTMAPLFGKMVADRIRKNSS
jgi:hypothetical protein